MPGRLESTQMRRHDQGTQITGQPTGSRIAVPIHCPRCGEEPPRNQAAADRHSLVEHGLRRPPRLAVLLLGADLITLILALGWMGRGQMELPLMLGVAMLVWAGSGLYRSRFTLSLLEDLPRLGLGVLVGTVVVVLLGMVTTTSSPGWWLKCGALLTAHALASRQFGYALEHRARRAGRRVGKVLVIGEGPFGQAITDALESDPAYGVTGPDASTGGVRSLPADTPVATLRGVAQRDGVTHLILTPEVMAAGAIATFVVFGSSRALRTYVIPPLESWTAFRESRADAIRGIPLWGLRDRDASGLARHIKRALDIVMACVSLVMSSPLLGVIALAVRYESGRIIFRQQRVRQGSGTFTMYKFTSLIPKDSQVEATWSIGEHPDVGRVGRFIRRTSLDELPQFVNVLRGDMSLVGPRPERPVFVTSFSEAFPGYARRHRVPVGMTGYSAIHGLRGDTSIRDRALLDNCYIELWSLWLDLKILVRTVSRSVWSSGA